MICGTVLRFAAMPPMLAASFAIGLAASTPFPLLAQMSGTWTDAGSLNTPRPHTATLHARDQVPVLGSENTNRFLNSAELYDPVIGTWTVTDSKAIPHIDHTMEDDLQSDERRILRKN
jgi:hypothetical protein